MYKKYTQEVLNYFIYSNLYLSFVCPGRSRLEYCLEMALKSFSFRPEPPLAGSNVGLAAVVIFKHALRKLVDNTRTPSQLTVL